MSRPSSPPSGSSTGRWRRPPPIDCFWPRTPQQVRRVIMSTPTPPRGGASVPDAPAEPSRSIASWRQRFPAPMSHEGHDVPNVNALFEERMTFGQRAADAVARQLGSWRFLIIQSGLLASWIAVNVAEVVFKPWDPYPFILLNLILSFQAAYAAPVLLMGANRQAEKD